MVRTHPPLHALIVAAFLPFAAARDLCAQPGERPEPMRRLKPDVLHSIDGAIGQSSARRQPIIAAVDAAREGGIPELFWDSRLARASKMTVTLASLDYASQVSFFRPRGIREIDVPCVLLLDHHGNVMGREASNADPDLLLASSRNVRRLVQSIEQELPRVLERAEELARGGEEKALLDLLRPWLRKHYRGYDGADRPAQLAAAFGEKRLAKAREMDDEHALREFGRLAEEYEHSPIQAAAMVEQARILDRQERRKEAAALLRRLLEDLPWPENAAAHEQAREMIGEFRRQEIERRRREAEETPP